MTGTTAFVGEVRTRVRLAWALGGPRQRAIVGAGLVAAAVLSGAFLFGAWHIVFGGLVKGNWRAGAFGVVLALASGTLLWLETVVVRRR